MTLENRLLVIDEFNRIQKLFNTIEQTKLKINISTPRVIKLTK
jgi:hypothetical protein